MEKPTSENRSQTPPDPDDVLAQLETFGEDDQPAEGQDSEVQFADTEEGKRQAHAFAKQQRLLRQAKTVIRNLKEKPAVVPDPPRVPQGAGDTSSQASAIMYQLQLEAIQNTGIANPDHPMVVLEMNRLYAEKVQQLRNRSEAGTKAPQVFATVLAKFKRLSPEDVQDIQARVRGLSPESQADEKVVTSVFNLYVGENIERFVNPPSGKGQEGSGGDDASTAASSSARSGRGVSPASRSGGGGVTPPKAPDEKEAREMRSIGLDPFRPEDVAQYRIASKRRAQFGAT